MGPGGEVNYHWRTPPALWEKLKPLAREMRRNPTPAEDRLWQRLRNRQLLGFKFRRQHPLDRFVLDFYCAEVGLVVEVDGPVHQYTPEEDAVRQDFLESQGLRVLRFTNQEVAGSLEAVVDRIASALSETADPAANSEHDDTFGPEDVFNYIYAVLHSPTYRRRYAEFLKVDFPRIPLTSDRQLFRALAGLGGELVALHLMESPTLAHLTLSSRPAHASGVVSPSPFTENLTPFSPLRSRRGDGGEVPRFPVRDDDVVEKGYPKYVEPEGPRPGRVLLNARQFFEGIEPEVWNFHVGGYQVCEKWLKDRRGRKLTWQDINRYQKVVVALRETIHLMREIDQAIGEWPFACGVSS